MQLYSCESNIVDKLGFNPFGSIAPDDDTKIEFLGYNEEEYGCYDPGSPILDRPTDPAP